MQAVVKTPLIDIKIKGSIPKKILRVLKEEYGKELHFTENSNDILVNVFETDWYSNISSEIKPGDNLKIYREMHKITQEKLGELLGGTPKQHISNMERGTRSISLKTAKQLAEIFKVTVEKFV